MCLARNQLSPKARRFFTIGNLCLFTGLTLSIFGKDLGLQHAAIYNGLRGFLVGLSIAFNLGAVRLARRSPESHP
ncbi:MAG TPA: hypothetical protein VH308_04370 [Terracidiphilus sp.]|nr:hypothetical protein [Terracidiphilus sp.]